MCRVVSFFVIIFFSINNNAMSQITRFENRAHELYFNVYTMHPDKSIIGFLKKYIPQLYHRPPKGNWKAVPPMNFESEHSCVHALEFTKHPYFDNKFYAGRLEFITKESGDNVVGLKDVRLWLDFDSYKSADIAFQSLINSFTPISTSKNIYEIYSSHVAEFVDENTKSSFNSVQFILMKNLPIKPGFQIFFRIGIDTLK